MLKTHFDAVENALLAISHIPANTGHNLHKGTPREAFIKEFLEQHLSEKVAIGTGEIIDAASQPGQQRNQIDIVVYQREYPKLNFGGGVNGFLAESVVATIEVKSVITKADLKVAFRTALNIKGLQRHTHRAMQIGHQPPSILCYLVAYEGPQSLETVVNWIPEINAELGIAYPDMPPDVPSRCRIVCPTLDAIFILGRGFVYFDNSPIGFLPDHVRKAFPQTRWIFSQTPSGNILFLFLMLTQAVSGHSAAILDPGPYLQNFNIPRIGWKE